MFTSENQPENRGRKKGSKTVKTIQIETLVRKLLEAIDEEDMKRIIRESRPDTIVNAIAKLAPKDLNVSIKRTLDDYSIDDLVEYQRKLKEIDKD